MALTDIVSFSIMDADGDRKSVPLYTPNTFTLAQLADMAGQMAVLLDAVIDGQIVAITIQHSITLPGGIKTAPEAYCEDQKGAAFSYDAASTNRSYTTFVPSFKPSLFVTGTDVVDNSDLDVQAFEDALADGLGVTGGGTVTFTDEYGNDLELFRKAVKRFRQ